MDRYLQVISSSSPLSNARLRVNGDQVIELDDQGRADWPTVAGAVHLEVRHQQRWKPLPWPPEGDHGSAVVLDVDNPFAMASAVSDDPGEGDDESLDRPIRRYALALFVVAVLFFLAAFAHFVFVESP